MKNLKLIITPTNHGTKTNITNPIMIAFNITISLFSNHHNFNFDNILPPSLFN